MQPFRLEMNVVLAAASPEEAAKVWDALVEALPATAFCDGGGVSPMDPVDVEPGSLLATALL